MNQYPSLKQGETHDSSSIIEFPWQLIYSRGLREDQFSYGCGFLSISHTCMIGPIIKSWRNWIWWVIFSRHRICVKVEVGKFDRIEKDQWMERLKYFNGIAERFLKDMVFWIYLLLYSLVKHVVHSWGSIDAWR